MFKKSGQTYKQKESYTHTQICFFIVSFYFKILRPLKPVKTLINCKTLNSNILSFHQVSPAAERLRYILNEDDDMPTPTLFTEMDTLQREGDELEWKESARCMTPSQTHTQTNAGTVTLLLLKYTVVLVLCCFAFAQDLNLEIYK